MILSGKGKMIRVAWNNRPRISKYEVECGAHGCDTLTTVRDPATLRAGGWLRVKGYGWICPKCQQGEPFPRDQS